MAVYLAAIAMGYGRAGAVDAAHALYNAEPQDDERFTEFLSFCHALVVDHWIPPEEVPVPVSTEDEAMFAARSDSAVGVKVNFGRDGPA